jgi:hypothetical protein
MNGSRVLRTRKWIFVEVKRRASVINIVEKQMSSGGDIMCLCACMYVSRNETKGKCESDSREAEELTR